MGVTQGGVEPALLYWGWLSRWVMVCARRRTKACTYMQLQHITQQVTRFLAAEGGGYFGDGSIALYLRNSIYLQCLSYHTTTQLVVQRNHITGTSAAASSLSSPAHIIIHLHHPSIFAFQPHLQLFIGLQLQISTNHPTTGACALTQPNAAAATSYCRSWSAGPMRISTHWRR